MVCLIWSESILDDLDLRSPFIVQQLVRFVHDNEFDFLQR